MMPVACSPGASTLPVTGMGDLSGSVSLGRRIQAQVDGGASAVATSYDLDPFDLIAQDLSPREVGAEDEFEHLWWLGRSLAWPADQK